MLSRSNDCIAAVQQFNLGDGTPDYPNFGRV